MADDSNEIQISITLDDGSVRQGFARIQQSGEETSGALAEAFNSAKNELLAIAAAYISFEAAKKFIEDAVEAASAYDKSLNDMNKSLVAAGGYSDEASAQFLNFANAMEQSTTLSSKQVLSLEALANNYAHTNEQALQLTKAAIELGAATGKGPNAALQQLGATLDGTAGRLVKLFPQLQNLTKYQLESGAALQVVLARLGGSAENDVNTYQGAIAKLGNAFESLQIALGQLVTQSPAVRTVIQFLTQELTTLGESLKGLGGNDSFMRSLINQSIEFGLVFNQVVITPLEVFYNVAKTVFSGIELAITATIASIAGVAGDLLSNFGIFSKSIRDMSDSLHNFANTADIAMTDFAEDTVDNFHKIGDTHFADKVEQEFVKMRDAVANSKPLDSFKKAADQHRDDALKVALANNTVETSFQNMRDGAYGAMADLVKNSTVQFAQIGTAAVKSLGGGLAQAMAAVGKAAVEGKDIFKAFAGAMISALGSALIQMGAGYIMIGLAREIASYGADATGYELIGIGSGMAALGGVLQAVGSNTSGSGASASASGYSSSSGGGGAASGDIAANPATQAQQTPQHATVNIQGSVFDTKETGLRIVELVNAAFTNQGVSVITQ